MRPGLILWLLEPWGSCCKTTRREGEARAVAHLPRRVPQMDLTGEEGRPPDTRTRLIHSRKYLAGSQDIGGLGGVSLGLYRVTKDSYCWLGAETFSKGPADTVQVNLTQFPVVVVRLYAIPFASPDFYDTAWICIGVASRWGISPTSN